MIELLMKDQVIKKTTFLKSSRVIPLNHYSFMVASWRFKCFLSYEHACLIFVSSRFDFVISFEFVLLFLYDEFNTYSYGT